jgi:hypothetical protein
MSDLDNSFKKLLEEQIGYGFGGAGQMPVQQAEFPVPGPQQPQVDPTRPVVTTGETTEAGEGRQDYAMEMGVEPVIEEVGNLIITIGHILNQAGLVADKYNLGEVMDFLNHNFEVPEYPTEENPPEEMDMPDGGCGEPPMAPPDDGMPAPEPQQLPAGTEYIYEAKKHEERLNLLVESKKNIDKDS